MPKNLLLADDSATIRRVVEICFSQEDVAVTGAAGADEALAKAKSRPPDVIVIDTFMPGKSGYDLAGAIRADPGLSNIPILLLASPNEPFNEARAQQLRVDAWIPKPFQSAALIDQVKRLLSGARPSAPPPARPAAPPPAAARPPTAPPPPRPAAPPAAAAPPRPATAPPPARPAAIVPPAPPRPAAPAVATGGQRPVAPAAAPRPGAPPPPRPPGAPAAVVAPPRPAAGAPGPVAAGTGVPPRPAAPAAARPPPAAAPAAQQLTAQNHAALLREAITKATKDMIEKVVWEVVPELAEAMIKERLDKLAKERGDLVSRGRMKSLTELAVQHDTDKAAHGYTDIYPRYIESIRSAPLRFLEIGVEKGKSMRMWREYFSNAEIIGADLDSNAAKNVGDGVRFVHVDQRQVESLRKLAAEGPFDVVIDDGSHAAQTQVLTFETLFSAIKPGGVYFCEDLQGQFLGHGNDGKYSRDSIDFFTNLAFRIQADGIGISGRFSPDVEAKLDFWQRSIEFVHFYRYLVAIGRRA